MANRKQTIKLLKRQIESNMVQSESLQYFFPENYLTVIFTLENLIKAIEELDCPVIETIGLAQTICEKGVRVFAILVKNGEEDLITEFRKHEVLDAQLPLDETRAKKIAGEFGIYFARHYQRQFLPYIFSRDMRDNYRTIDASERILPFVGQSDIVASGGFGDISRVEIFHSQQKFSIDKVKSRRSVSQYLVDLLISTEPVWMDISRKLTSSQSCPVQVIRKEIRLAKGQTKDEYDDAFRSERQCLLLLDGLTHPNIIRLLGSYTYEGKHNFLFPSYEMDLRVFLQSESRFGSFSKKPTFFSALRGLTSALCSTHKLHLEKEKHGLEIDRIDYHHDLRPANILVSHDTFILADFGLGKFKPADVPSQTQWKVEQGDYLAPERMDEDFVHQDVGRAVDVWAFGCLLIEVIIYMEKGPASLREFREQRMSPSRYENWKDACFYDRDGSLKPIVIQWLDSLTRDLLRPGPLKMLADVSRGALKRQAEDRPRIEFIYTDLTLISLKAHFIACRNLFHEYVERNMKGRSSETSNNIKLWFASERLTAFGYVTGFDSSDMSSSYESDLNSRYDEHLKILNTIIALFQDVEVASHAVKAGVGGETKSSARIHDHSGERIEHDVCGQVENLWQLLPINGQRKAESAWLRTMLNTDDVGRLDHVEKSFKSEIGPVFEKGAAIAMMKKIALNIKSNPASMPKGFTVSKHDFQRRCQTLYNHEIGRFKGMPVLIEWMRYYPGWKKVSPEQRAAVMSLKVEGFSEKTKPAGMRTLDCVGTFEDTEDEAGYGYGFLYRIPTSDPDLAIESSTATLLQLLENEKRQPLLSDKLRLAFVLAQFLEDFHNVGWLHKNLILTRLCSLISKIADRGKALSLLRTY